VPPEVEDNRLGVALTYDSTRRYPFSVSRSRGNTAVLTFETSELLGGDVSGEIWKLDWRSYIPTGREQVLAVRLAGGSGTEGARRFHLGGEAGAFDLGGRSPAIPSIPPPPFDDRDDPLRGYPDNAFSGRHMLLASLEWRFPIRRVERGLGLLPLGLENISGRLFAEAGSAWDQGSRPDDVFPSAGLELLLEPYIGYLPGLELRLGFAHGFEDLGEDSFYAALGTSF
jgi:outer membrane protein assembly factor BamA